MWRFVHVPARSDNDIPTACKSFPVAADFWFCSDFCGSLFRARPERGECNEIAAEFPSGAGVQPCCAVCDALPVGFCFAWVVSASSSARRNSSRGIMQWEQGMLQSQSTGTASSLGTATGNFNPVELCCFSWVTHTLSSQVWGGSWKIPTPRIDPVPFHPELRAPLFCCQVW